MKKRTKKKSIISFSSGQLRPTISKNLQEGIKTCSRQNNKIYHSKYLQHPPGSTRINNLPSCRSCNLFTVSLFREFLQQEKRKKQMWPVTKSTNSRTYLFTRCFSLHLVTCKIASAVAIAAEKLQQQLLLYL